MGLETHITVVATEVCQGTGQIKRKSFVGNMPCSRSQIQRQFNEINIDPNVDKAT